MASLDIEAVRAFVMVADFQSFTRAAEALGTSQATISAKLKRLEDRIGERLIERTPRLVRLSARGATFLGAARDFVAAHERAFAALSTDARHFVLGISDQLSGSELPMLLARLHASDPSLTMEVHINASRALLDAFGRGELDAAIVRRDDDRRDGEILTEERFGWFAAPTFEFRVGEPLRLASLAPTCGLRDVATRLLDKDAILWTEVFVGGGSAAVTAAVSAGLAVAPLANRIAPTGAVEVGKRFGLPPLPSSTVMLHSTLSDTRSREALRTLAAAFRDHRAST